MHLFISFPFTTSSLSLRCFLFLPRIEYFFPPPKWFCLALSTKKKWIVRQGWGSAERSGKEKEREGEVCVCEREGEVCVCERERETHASFFKTHIVLALSNDILPPY